jgi:signal transduction histidine kinase
LLGYPSPTGRHWFNELRALRPRTSDTGPGLSQASAERVFEAFYTTKASGLGMGLSICRSIIQNRGRRLWATPNQPRGTVFCFTVPIGEKSPENLEPSEA